MAHQSRGNLKEAEACYQQALRLGITSAVLYGNLGSVLHELGRQTEALAAYESAVRSNPRLSQVWTKMGLIHEKNGCLDEAESCYRTAVDLKRETYPLWLLALLSYKTGKWSQSEECYRKFIRREPANIEAHINLAILLYKQRRFNELYKLTTHALSLDPDSVEIRCLLALALRFLGRIEEAVKHFEFVVVKKHSTNDACIASYFQMLQISCAWPHLAAVEETLDQLTKAALRKGGKKTGESPFIHITRCMDEAYNFAVARSWSSDIARDTSALCPGFQYGNRSAADKIKVGYVSSDFHDHATMHLMAGMFRLHDRGRFKLYFYSYGASDESRYRRTLLNDQDTFIDIRTQSALPVAKRIHEDGIDILVDLKGHTAFSRMEIFALRPAPLQVAYLGYPGTTGADFIDYIVADEVVIPESHTAYYSEKVVWMPHCYQVNDNTQAISEKPFTRADFDLPGTGTVFCSFNQTYKIEPVIFDVWMRILKSVPNSVLWLLRSHQGADRNLRMEAANRGVDPNRLIFADLLPKEEHLARIRLADLALDTRIVNGHTTVSDALWAGVPVIALQGSHFASRVSSSILNAAGLAELTAFNVDEYLALATSLATDEKALSVLRQRLRENGMTCALFDTLRFTRHFEKALQQVWVNFAMGRAPRHFKIPFDPADDVAFLE